MKSGRWSRYQNFFLLLAGIGAIAGMTAKMNLSLNEESARNIDFGYFYSHVGSVPAWAYAYWGGVGLFLSSLLVGVLLQWINDRPD